MDWDTFSKESHQFQCGKTFNTDTSKFTIKDFEAEMRKKGYEITVYEPTECADWWCNDQYAVVTVYRGDGTWKRNVIVESFTIVVIVEKQQMKIEVVGVVIVSPATLVKNV